MALVLLDVGAEQILNSYFNKENPAGGNNLSLKLFTNNVTPADTGISYTECTITGYSAITLTAGNWTVESSSGIKQARYSQCVYTFTGNFGATVYGYYVVDADSVIVYAERSEFPFTPTTNGDILVVTPIFQLSKGTPT